ncbi:MAG TPA: 6-pyruvoyl-tetrahydropterin synthase-related protein, partial [Pyrinomonadaceae bacterium]|nr:6-pyruvoyl-tetrahydropterin synthase-related protein [Pyrinomonadaceae bacterium]
MSQTTRKPAKQDWKSLLFIVAFAIAAIAPAMFRGVPASRDLQHHFRLGLAFKEGFSQGDFYPGWLSEANNGYGDASLRFYPPGLAFLLAAVQTVINNWYVTALLVFTLLTLLGGLGTYTWARSFVRPEMARWAAALFIFMPYRINELYQSSLLAEYAAAAVLPFVFAFTERLCRNGGRRNIAGLAAAYAFLILTNLPMTVIGSYALVVYVLLRMDWSKLFPTVWKFVAALALGLGASACFWVTVLAELSWLRPDNEASFSRMNFIFASFRAQPGGTNIWYGNLIVLATIAITLPALILFRRSEDSAQRSVWRRVGLFAIFSLLMSTIISFPVWEILPKLKEVQLPWRWLAVTSAASAVMVAASIDSWKEVAKSNRRPLALLAAGAVLMSLAFTISHPIREARYFSESRFNEIIAT